MKILITGYAGFIGSNLTRKLFNELEERDQIFGIDSYTYAAKPQWVFDSIPAADPRVRFYRIDLRNFKEVMVAVKFFKPDQVYHLAAESHVCRSIEGPRMFVETNVMGTFNLIEALRQTGFKGRMVHVSTDETFGELEMAQELFNEETLLKPTSPYSSTKASSDLIVQAFNKTYGLKAMVTRCTNNYGPNQHKEKLIAKTIDMLSQDKPMTIYGKGTNVRDWIWVDDHCEALQVVMKNGSPGEIYCIGSGLEIPNNDVIKEVAREMGKEPNKIYTDGRTTDDTRYAVSTKKIEGIGWEPNPSIMYFRKRIRETINWYAKNKR